MASIAHEVTRIYHGQHCPRSHQDANNESSEVCVNIKPGRRVKLNRSQAVNVRKLLTIRFNKNISLIKSCQTHNTRYYHHQDANNESSEVFAIIKPGRRVKLNRSQAENVHKLLTMRYLPPG